MRVCGLEFTPETIHRIRARLGETPEISRRSLARSVCEWMDWRSANGNPKEAVCRKALAFLAEEGFIELPCRKMVRKSDGGSKQPASTSIETVGVACELSELGTIALEMVGGRYTNSFRTWKDLMDAHHYLGSGPLYGAQLWYLIHSSVHGYVGGLGFSSGAWALNPTTLLSTRHQFLLSVRKVCAVIPHLNPFNHGKELLGAEDRQWQDDPQ